MQPIVAKFRTFGEAEEATREYYRKLSPGERLEILFQLRALAHKEGDAPSGRLARFIESLNSNGVEYLIVGAVALAYHGFPRYTGDLDVLVRNSPGNTRRLESALAGFGFASLGLKAADFADSYRVIQLECRRTASISSPRSRVCLSMRLGEIAWTPTWKEPG